MTRSACLRQILTGGALCITAALATAATTARPAVVRQPRSVGYQIGDVLTQRVLLDHESLADAGPPAERTGLWLERHAPRLSKDATGRQWLELDYQVINTPRHIESASLPPVQLAMRSGSSLAVPAWPISLGPISPPERAASSEADNLRPDRTARAADPEVELQATRPWAAGLLACAACWLGWWIWRQRHERVHLPFARARLALQRLERQGEGDSEPAWRLLHRAINDTAGSTIHAGNLGQWLAEAPGFASLRAELDGFFQHSGRKFFSGQPTDGTFNLTALCKALCQVERQQAE